MLLASSEGLDAAGGTLLLALPPDVASAALAMLQTQVSH